MWLALWRRTRAVGLFFNSGSTCRELGSQQGERPQVTSAYFEHSSRQRSNSPALPSAHQDRLSPKRSFRHQVVRVARLSVASSPIAEYRFENCEIVGPGIFSEFSQVTLSSCTFESTVCFLDLPPHASGTLRLRRCAFVHCAFADLGFALRAEEKRVLLERVARRL
jgi:hypothetical protein